MSRDGIFPIPINDSLPDTLKSDPDQRGASLVAAWESNFQRYLDDIKALSYCNDPDMCPAEDLPRLASKYGLDSSEYETELLLRRAISKAVQILHFLGMWTEHVKPTIDWITGYSCELYGRHHDNGQRQDFILTPYEDTMSWRRTYGLLSGPGDTVDGIPMDGLVMVGTWEEWYIAGNVYIDIGSGATAVSQAVIDSVRNKLLLVSGGFAFYRIYLGSIISGVFNIFNNGVIP